METQVTSFLPLHAVIESVHRRVSIVFNSFECTLYYDWVDLAYTGIPVLKTSWFDVLTAVERLQR